MTNVIKMWFILIKWIIWRTLIEIIYCQLKREARQKFWKIFPLIDVIVVVNFEWQWEWREWRHKWQWWLVECLLQQQWSETKKVSLDSASVYILDGDWKYFKIQKSHFHYLALFNTIFVSSHMYYPKNPDGIRVIVGSMNLRFDIYLTLPGIKLTTCSVSSARRFH